MLRVNGIVRVLDPVVIKSSANAPNSGSSKPYAIFRAKQIGGNEFEQEHELYVVVKSKDINVLQQLELQKGMAIHVDGLLHIANSSIFIEALTLLKIKPTQSNLRKIEV